MSQADAVFRNLEQRILGRRVTSTRMFLFTLQIYFAADDDTDQRLAIWCEPSWHVRTARGIVTGSGAIESPSTFDDDDEVARASATITRASELSEVLVGQSLTSIHVDPTTCALTAGFSGELIVATFSDDPDAETLWVLRDAADGAAVRGTLNGIALGIREPAL